MAEKNIELLPCPFCGAAPMMGNALSDIEKWEIYCTATMCLVSPRTLALNGKEKTIAVWNNRSGIIGDWTPVAGGSRPEYDIPVMAIPQGYPDRIDAAMLIYEDGWLWASYEGFGSLTDPTCYEVDDDYQYTHWKYFPSTKITKGK